MRRTCTPHAYATLTASSPYERNGTRSGPMRDRRIADSHCLTDPYNNAPQAEGVTVKLSSLTIKTKLLLGFGTLAAIAIVICAMSLRALSQTTEAFSAYIHGLDARAEMAVKVRTAVDRRAIAARNLVLVTQQADLDIEKADVAQAHEDVKNNLRRLKEMALSAPAGAQELVAEIDRVETRYGPVALDIVSLALAKRNDEAIAKMNNECRPLLAALVKATEAYAAFTRTRQEETIRQMEADYALQRQLLIGISIAAVALAVIGGLLLTRAITRPIERAVDAARAVAQGELGQRIDVESDDETGRLLRALRDMTARLAQIVNGVRDSSGRITGATGEIAAGNVDLSARTEQQAASLEETAASIEELTVTVRQNSENAREASTLAHDAADVAQKGSTAVGRVVDTMQQISASSEKIAEITGIIEGIAFQTNILALNAAVEAARAGEQGRGFAVVASEVRSLAQRSSSAAKEIKELISVSVQQVHAGSTLAGEAGETMGVVTQAVARVNRIIEEIAQASGEQSRGIEQVNQAISQIDHVTQQNATLVSEAASASRAMEEEARRLKEAVAFFRLPAARSGGRLAPAGHGSPLGDHPDYAAA